MISRTAQTVCVSRPLRWRALRRVDIQHRQHLQVYQAVVIMGWWVILSQIPSYVLAEVVSTLFFHEMKYDIANPKCPSADRFVLSKVIHRVSTACMCGNPFRSYRHSMSRRFYRAMLVLFFTQPGKKPDFFRKIRLCRCVRSILTSKDIQHL